MDSPDELKAHQMIEKAISERWVMGRWNHQMSLKKSSSMVEWEHPPSEVTRKSRAKGFGRKLSKVSLGHERGFKILLDNGAKM
jgi:hypothetical protein